MRGSPLCARVFLFYGLLTLASCDSESAISQAASPLNGREIYLARCASCHQPDGGGLPGISPPLSVSPQIQGSPESLIRVLLLGLKGPLVRDGVTYNGIMPAWRYDLTDDQLVLLINELYARWNPTALPITESTVSHVRAATAKDRLFPTPEPIAP